MFAMQPLNVLMRTLLVSALVLTSTYTLRHSLAATLVRVLPRTVYAIDKHFEVLSVDVQEGADDLRIKANLRQPIDIGAHRIVPFGWHGHAKGWFQVDLPVGGILLYPSVVLILVLSWPATRAGAYVPRLLLTVPMLIVLLFIDLPFTVVAQLWFQLHDEFQPHALWPVLIWSRFLMGGGGFAIALAMGVVILRMTGESSPESVLARLNGLLRPSRDQLRVLRLGIAPSATAPRGDGPLRRCDRENYV